VLWSLDRGVVIVTFAETAALEVQRYGVTSQAISPIAATRMLAGIGRTPADAGRWDPLGPANASLVVARLCNTDSGWLTGAVLRIDGNTLQRVSGWAKTGGYTAKSGEQLTLDELGIGLGKLYGVMPPGTGG
jgi:hypothetical protein